jgi:N-acyl homoserine lactone hydrolase
LSIKIHALQTGSVLVKKSQRVRKTGGLIRVLLDKEWTEWLPIYAWLIEHPKGIFIIDTGETAQTSMSGYFPKWHPYYRTSVRMDVKPEDEIGEQLKRIGIKEKDIRLLILTHFHTDHAGGLHHFKSTDILVSEKDFRLARSIPGRLMGYLPHRWPAWFDPDPIHFKDTPFGPFTKIYEVTDDGTILIVQTPGHTLNHISVIVKHEDLYYFLAGDTSYNEKTLIERTVDGVSLNASVTLKTIDNILLFIDSHPTVYLPTHDPDSGNRLEKNQVTKRA